MSKVNPFLSVVLIVAMMLVLAACAAGGEEPAATDLDPTNTPEPPLDDAAPLEEADEETMGQVAPAGEGATVETRVEEESGTFTDTKVATDTISPVVVDVDEITPDAADGGDGELKEMPAPGVPNPEVKMEQQVKTDLAGRLGIDVGDITVVENEEVQWPNSALGCPEEGMAYMQVITPGFKITLEAGGERYTYHTDQGENAVLCGDDGHPVESE